MAEPTATQRAGWRFWIDRGGTFTDIIACDPQGRLSTRKLLSDRGRDEDATLTGITLSLGLPAGAPIPAAAIESVRMGTTVATNALLERRGARVLLLLDRGFADLLLIGDQARPNLFDLAVTRPQPLHERCVEITGRVGAEGDEIEPLDEAAARAALDQARAEGIECCAIALIHAWRHPAMERRLAALARVAGFTQVSASHEVSPLLRLVPRAQTSVVDAYLSPLLRRHVDQLRASLPDTRLLFMQSHGGLVDGARFAGRDAILSGPAGGIVAAARTAERAGFERVISFDMGGTSTDVALYAGAFERRFETVIDGLRLRVPMLAIHTIAAGGGSILRFDGTRLRVGPQSAGADPGPRAYRRGGPLTVTDANICLGKIQPAHFPSLFGADGDAPLDAEAVRHGFAALAEEIAAATGVRQHPHVLAEGFLRLAVTSMAGAIREVSVRRGQDPADFVLHCFGGAGGQHACLVAGELGMRTILIHPFAGILSALGMGLAEQSVMREQAVEMPLEPEAMQPLRRLVDALSRAAQRELAEQIASGMPILTECRLHLRHGTSDAVLIVPFDSLETMAKQVASEHRARFGFDVSDPRLVVDAVVVEARAPAEALSLPQAPPRAAGEVLRPVDTVEIWSGGRAHRAPLFQRSTLRAGDRLQGPALVSEANATTVIEPGWDAEITGNDDMILRDAGDAPVAAAEAADDDRADPMRVELFNNLFMNVAEQAGAVLQHTAQSVNIRERLDFSCAVFDADGALVANAPHVPVHLGAMGESVRTVLRRRAHRLRPGDVIALNNPFDGGTHLPDVTVITPVFDPDDETLVFFAASRGHHADIGGSVPGSTPAFSRRLEEEGIVIDDFLLVSNGRFREAEFRALLAASTHPARSPDVNVADIRAQIAANARASNELHRLLALHGRRGLRVAMRQVMGNAEESVRRAITRLRDGSFTYGMDDASQLRVAVRIDAAAREAVIDFTGTSPQRADNFNAPPAVLRAVVLYVFRCLAGDDIPLNDGCLVPLRIVIPPGTFLSPEPGAAVVAGNTEVSQAACNALFAALGVLACSQGTMNNLLFGDDSRQYYETICGGTGAGAGFDGADAVQSHMTNTRMTDPEVLELRYPVRVEQFSVRAGSGGDGARRGGSGATRRLRFLAPMQAVLVSSRREVPPFGLQGGLAGAAGRQTIERADGRIEPVGGIAQMRLMPGDAITIETPGGGGYGTPASLTDTDRGTRCGSK